MDPTLRAYADRVRVIPKLSEQEEQILARRWRESGDRDARNLLVQSQLRFVLAVAQRYARPGELLGDFVAEGNVGLLHAASKFDPERGHRFVTYAKHWVRVFVSECASRQSKGAIYHGKDIRKARRERARAQALLGDEPEAAHLMAERLRRSTKQIERLLCQLEQREVSFEQICGEPGARSDEALFSTEPTPEEQLLERAESRSNRDAVRAALTQLNARERRIVTERLMVDAESMCTLNALAREFGISRERVRQLEVRLKQKLAAQLRSLTHAAAQRCDAAA